MSYWVGVIDPEGVELSAAFGGRQWASEQSGQTLEWPLHEKAKTPAVVAYYGFYTTKKWSHGPIRVTPLPEPQECQKHGSIFFAIGG